MTDEVAWRKSIAEQVRKNCTLDWEVMQKGGDWIIYGVADWIENPPEWSKFDAPDAQPATADREKLARAYDPEAFEEHDIERRSRVAAIQWSARRKLATDAADRLLASGVIVPANRCTADRETIARYLARAALDWVHNDCGEDEHDLGHTNWEPWLDDVDALFASGCCVCPVRGGAFHEAEEAQK